MNLDEKKRQSLHEYIFSPEVIHENEEVPTVALERLKRSQELLLTVLSCTTQGICFLKKGAFAWCNDAFSNILGWNPDDLEGQSIDALWCEAGECGKPPGRPWNSSGENGPMVGEYVLAHKSGARIPCLVAVRPWDGKDPSGDFILFITDLTDRRHSRLTQENACADLERKTAGTSRDSEDPNRETAEHKAVDESPHQNRRHLEGLVRRRTAMLTAMNEDLLREIDVRKRAEEELEKTNDYLESILMNSPDAITIADQNGELIRWSKMTAESHGVAFDRLKGKTFCEFFADPVERDEVLAELRKHGFIDRREVRFRKNDGTVVPMEVSIRLLLDDENRHAGSVAISRDLSQARKMLATLRKTNKRLNAEIAARQRVEEALRGSENLYRTIFENTGAATIIVGEDGTILMTNAENLNLSGYSKQEILGKMKWMDFIHEDDLEMMLEYSRLRRLGGDSAPKRYEFRLKDRYGGVKHVWITTAVIPGTGKTVASLMDITEQKRMETEVVRTQKLESLGILAGGIAHDFNNFLTAILGNASLARIAAGHDRKLAGHLEEMEKAALRARDLTQQLLTFSRGGMPVKKTVSLAQVISESATFALRGSNVKVRFSFPDEPWLVDADEGQIGQVVNNLVINADQAMPDGGIIDIVLDNILIDETASLPFQPGPYVRISIRDEGVGIPEEAVGRIFDPYFTTSRKGSGLGLTTAYSIVAKHGGHVAVQSRVGVGTNFDVYLPVSEKEAPLQPAARDSVMNGKGRILVMDDEEIVRDVIGEMLAYLGYQVEFALDGAEAIQVYKKSRELGKHFDAFIMDLTVPGGMGGKEAVRQLLELDPTIKAIVSSGYSHDPIMGNHKAYGFADVVSKPYRIQDIAEVLNRVIPSQAQADDTGNSCGRSAEDNGQ